MCKKNSKFNLSLYLSIIGESFYFKRPFLTISYLNLMFLRSDENRVEQKTIKSHQQAKEAPEKSPTLKKQPERLPNLGGMWY